MDHRGDKRDDTRGGLGLGGPQRDIGGNDGRQDEGGTSEQGEGQQRHSGGSSRDSEKLG